MTPRAEVANSGKAVPGGIGNPADALWNLIIRPPRATYSTDRLGPRHFRVDGRACVRRTDARLRNPRGHALECSFFEPLPQLTWEHSRAREAAASSAPDAPLAAAEGASPHAAAEGLQPLPCVLFLHGNSSCRLEAAPLIALLMPLSISLFCFDFSGCGLSEGKYISLGWFERDDLSVCIDYLRSSGRVSTIALWGRSMGAFTALLHADRDPSIAGLVLDSPFTSLALLAEELARTYVKVPSWTVRALLAVVRAVVQAKAGFSIDDLKALDHVSHSFSPALFIAATGDDFIRPHHAKALYEAYQGEKEIHLVDGDHHSARSEACRRKAVLFLCRAFHDPRLDHLLRRHDCGLYDIFSGAPQPLRLGGVPATPESPGGGELGEADEDGAALCRQMQALVALERMALLRRRSCCGPFMARTALKLMQDNAEAGFFLRLEPPAGLEEALRGLPHLLVVSVSASAMLVSRVCDDSLETLAAASGLPPREERALSIALDHAGRLRLRLGSQAPLEVSCGVEFQEEATLWLMRLSGNSTFGTLTVEDGEATLRGTLDAALRSRHLGGPVPRCAPARLPKGDSGRMPLSPSPALHHARVAGQDASADAADEVVKVRRACACHPEALVGWRVRVTPLGEGLVVGVRRRWGRSTQHLLSMGDNGHVSVVQPLVGTTEPLAKAVLLRRKDSHRRTGSGFEFEPLWREF